MFFFRSHWRWWLKQCAAQRTHTTYRTCELEATCAGPTFSPTRRFGRLGHLRPWWYANNGCRMLPSSSAWIPLWFVKEDTAVFFYLISKIQKNLIWIQEKERIVFRTSNDEHRKVDPLIIDIRKLVLSHKANASKIPSSLSVCLVCSTDHLRTHCSERLCMSFFSLPKFEIVMIFWSPFKFIHFNLGLAHRVKKE